MRFFYLDWSKYQLQYFYNEKNYQKILSSSKELSHSLSLVIVEFLQKELLSQNIKSSEGQEGKQKGNIIDITGEWWNLPSEANFGGIPAKVVLLTGNCFA